MSNPLEARSGQKQPLTADTLLEPGKIESLVQSGRIPVVHPHIIDGVPMALVVLPPEGAQFGDSIVGSGTFISPDGEKRGPLEIVVVSRDQLLPIRERAAKALDELSNKPAEPKK